MAKNNRKKGEAINPSPQLFLRLPQPLLDAIRAGAEQQGLGSNISLYVRRILARAHHLPRGTVELREGRPPAPAPDSDL